MANNLSSNVTRQVARVFLENFEASRVLTKAVDTQLLSGKFSPKSGATVDFKRPHDYNSLRTSGGDISSSTKSDIISGKATGTVQDYFTVATEWGNLEEAIQLDQLDTILKPMATRLVTDLELDLGKFMINNGGFSFGDPDVAVDAWSDVAGAIAKATAMGIPSDNLYYVMNPFVQQNLADAQSALASGKTSLVDSAWERAQISRNFGGANVMSSNAIKTRVSSTTGDRAGAVASVGASTYVAHKDTMIQTINVDAFSGTPVVKAGEIVEVTGKYQLNLATREPMVDGAGNLVKWRGVVTEDSAAFVGGAGSIKVAGPAIYEADGQYNTVNAALADGDVITILGTDTTTYQPSLLFHKQAFGLGTVKLPKLYSTDTVATTEDGFSIRISKYADGDKNTQMIRFDLLPAFACFSPYFGGQAFGVSS
jgi:hypothetical protein